MDIAFESATVVEAKEFDVIFRWLRTFISKAKSCAHLVVRRISSFINDFYRPSEAYYEAVKEYVRLGPDLSVNALFRTLIGCAKCQLESQVSRIRYCNATSSNIKLSFILYSFDTQEYGEAYAEALGAMLELRSYLLDVRDVIELQRLVCREAFQNRNCKPALSLLSSLLTMNNELVPSPIQVSGEGTADLRFHFHFHCHR